MRVLLFAACNTPGLAAIINLAGTAGNKSLFGASDACETVIKLISFFTQAPISNTDVPLHGSWAVLSLIDNSPDNLAKFRSLRAKEVLTSCIVQNKSISNKAAKAKAAEVVAKL